MQSEHEIQSSIMVAVSAAGHHIFRTNVGSVKMADGRYFSTGLPPGYPDLTGYRKQDNQIFFLEIKNAKGRPRPDQIRFHQQLMRDGVIHGISRSVEDALKIIDEGLIGWGYPDYRGDSQ